MKRTVRKNWKRQRRTLRQKESNREKMKNINKNKNRKKKKNKESCGLKMRFIHAHY